jgi:hypothetical protein
VQLLNWSVDLDETLYVEDDIDSIVLNLVASTIPRRRTFKLLRWCKFEPIGGFGWHFVWRWWHLRWPWLHAVQSRSFNHFKMEERTSGMAFRLVPSQKYPWSFAITQS